jgi:hypothetical protein
MPRRCGGADRQQVALAETFCDEPGESECRHRGARRDHADPRQAEGLCQQRCST